MHYNPVATILVLYLLSFFFFFFVRDQLFFDCDAKRSSKYAALVQYWCLEQKEGSLALCLCVSVCVSLFFLLSSRSVFTFVPFCFSFFLFNRGFIGHLYSQKWCDSIKHTLRWRGNTSTFETLTFLSAPQPTNRALYTDCACFIMIYLKTFFFFRVSKVRRDVAYLRKNQLHIKYT